MEARSLGAGLGDDSLVRVVVDRLRGPVGGLVPRVSGLARRAIDELAEATRKRLLR